MQKVQKQKILLTSSLHFFNSSLLRKQIMQGYIRKNGQKMQEMRHREEKRNSHPDRK